MTGSFLYRCTTIVVAGVTAICFGLVGQVSVQAASISHTGPDSYNSIKTINSNECTVTNNNNVNVNNANTQSAVTGNVSVKHNTTAGWGAWDPAVWQAQGHTYAEWHAAFMNYMASHQAEWSANWGSLAPSGGSASSGNATNTNNTNIGININNGASYDEDGDTCGSPACCDQTPGVPGTPGQSGSHGGVVLGAATAGTSQSGGHGKDTVGNVLGVQTSGPGGNPGASGQHPQSSSVSGSSHPGGSSTPNPCGCQPGSSQPSNTISNTGPNSRNSITNVTKSITTVTNNNNVNTSNISSQSSSTGNVSISHNTTTSGGNSGDGGNQNNTNAGVTLNN